MLHEFIVWCEKKMRAKDETHSADHMLELLAMIEGMTQEEGMAIMQRELERISEQMKAEMREFGHSVNHGLLWTRRLNVEQALKGGNGFLNGWN